MKSIAAIAVRGPKRHGTQIRLSAPGGFDADLAKLLAEHYELWLAPGTRLSPQGRSKSYAPSS
jgi:hypothetical protein